MADILITCWTKELAEAPAPVIALAHEGKAELQRMREFRIRLLEPTDLTVWVEDPQTAEPLGVQCTVRQDGGRVWWVDMTYVRPDARRRGVHEAIRDELRALAKADERCQAIEYHVRADNEAMIKNAARAGLQPASLHYRLDVRKLRRG